MTTTQQLYDAAVRASKAMTNTTYDDAYDNARDALKEAIEAYEAERAKDAERNDWR